MVFHYLTDKFFGIKDCSFFCLGDFCRIIGDLMDFCGVAGVGGVSGCVWIGADGFLYV